MESQSKSIDAGIGFIAICITLLLHFQLLPLHQANVVFSESGIKIEADYPFKNENDGSLVIGDHIVPLIENIGQSPAQNVRFTLYVIKLIGDNIPKLIFDEYIIHDLQPTAKSEIGYFNIADAELKNSSAVLIFHLQYRESLGITNQLVDKIFLFRYDLGADRVTVLAGSDYKNIYDRLKRASPDIFENDEYMSKFLENNPPEKFTSFNNKPVFDPRDLRKDLGIFQNAL